MNKVVWVILGIYLIKKSGKFLNEFWKNLV
jgi:hypothetical protein